jgi:hypothetical protein
MQGDLMATPFARILLAFGIDRMPWVIRVYLVLFVLCGALLLFSVLRAPDNLPTDLDHPAIKLFALASDMLKLVVGALLGSLSMAATHKWGNPTTGAKGIEE